MTEQGYDVERLGVFATADEIAHIKRCQDMPIMTFGSVGNPIPIGDWHVRGAVNKALIAHNLPCDGHGIDMKTGEFFRMKGL